MPSIEINDMSSLGVIRDVEGYMLPPEAFTLGNNVRFEDNGVELIGGAAQVFDTPTVAPHFLLPVASNSQTFWIYTSLTKAYVYDGATHTNITRQSVGVDVDYTATQTREWNGTLLGGVPILNNGVDVPQFWAATLAPATKLANLTNWDSNHRAKVLRAFGPYLVAFNVTKSGTSFGHLVMWSHPADPGSVPSSWDVADATVDAGQTDLADVSAGVIVDAGQLRGNMMVYKEGSTWRMSAIGGAFIFRFDSFLETSGILAPRCFAVTADGQRHVVATQDDIIVHNGQSAESVLSRRMKQYLFNQISVDNYLNCFMYSNPFRNEIGFCYPESGQTNPNKALVWNYREGQLGALSERDIDFRNTAIGTIETAADATWSSTTETWSSYVGPWSQSNRRKVVTANTDVTKMAEMDSGSTNLGTAILGTLQRIGISVTGRKRSGEWIVDYQKRKVMRRVWLKLAGGPVDVRIGFQALVDGPVTWSAVKSFDPASQKYIDVTGNGAAVCIEISGSTPWRLLGYKLEGEIAGEL